MSGRRSGVGIGVPGVPTWLSKLVPALAAARPGLLHGMRLTAAVCLALWITFSLELDAPFWAGTSAAISCQPTLGASRRKGTARLFGTLTGAVFVVLLAAAFPQSRYGFLLGIAVWGGACAFTATLLSNFTAYAASLSGYTVAIIAGDVMQSTNQVFTLAVSRASEIAIGIVCATIVVAGTDLGHARRELLQQLSSIVADLAAHLLQTLQMPSPAGPDSRPVRRDLLKRTAALDPVMDRAFGEVSDLRARQATLRVAVNGLFVAAAEWRTIDGHFCSLSDEQSREEASAVLQVLPAAARHLLEGGGADWASDPATGRDLCTVAARACASIAAKQPSHCVTAERTAAALLSLAAAANGLTLLVDPAKARIVARQPAVWGGQDLLPSLVNAVRVFLTIASVALFWIATEWPGGQGAITFAFISVILLSPQNEKAAGAATSFAVGVGLVALWAGVAKFALLPGQQTFLGLAGVLGMTLVPLGALATLPRLALMFGSAATNFMPLLAPTNIISYDTEAFYNSALSIVAGVAVAALAMRLIPPVPAATRTRNLLNAALAELRALADGRRIMAPKVWRARTFRRFAAMPDAAEPLQRAWLLAALTAGSDIIVLRRLGDRSAGSLPRLEACLQAIAEGRVDAAVRALANLESGLVEAADPLRRRSRLRARSASTTLRETLQAHERYFSYGDGST